MQGVMFEAVVHDAAEASACMAPAEGAVDEGGDGDGLLFDVGVLVPSHSFAFRRGSECSADSGLDAETAPMDAAAEDHAV